MRRETVKAPCALHGTFRRFDPKAAASCGSTQWTRCPQLPATTAWPRATRPRAAGRRLAFWMVTNGKLVLDHEIAPRRVRSGMRGLRESDSDDVLHYLTQECGLLRELPPIGRTGTT